MDFLTELNPAQQDAVKTIDGPLLILAGAGSGKTKVLTHRIAHLIQDHGVSPDEILAVTFTNKAAKEMRERLAHLLKVRNNWYFMPWMGTFHAICIKILRQHGTLINLDAKFIIYDQTDRERLIKQAIKNLNLSALNLKPKRIVSIISNLKNQLKSAQDYQPDYHSLTQQAIKQVFVEYEKLRRQAKALDFDDILFETYKLLKNHLKARRHYQQQLQFILIDEYQDTNFAQYKLIKLLTNDRQNLCVVGDDWQSIYSWRGADFTNILNFEKDFFNTKVIKLEQNYRSTNNILRVAQKVIEKNTHRSHKTLWTEAGDGAEVIWQSSNTDIEEANWVATKIADLKQAGYSYQDMAILYRTNAQNYLLERAMLSHQIPHQIIGGVRLFDRKEVKDIVAYLRLLYQPFDQVSFERIVNVPARQIGQATVNKFLNHYWLKTDYSLIKALAEIDKSDLSVQIQNKLTKFHQIMTKIADFYATNPPLGDLVAFVIKETGYRAMLEADELTFEDKMEHLSVLQSQAQLYADLASFLEDASLLSSSDDARDEQKVTLMTIHAAKGLEFPIVFLVGMEEGLLPHARVFDNPDELEEERRLCYVAMTRAKQELFLSSAESRMNYGKKSFCQVSQFLVDAEICHDDFHYSDDDVVIDVVNDFEVGDLVCSMQFGDGKVIDVDGLAVSVQFKNGKIRKLNIEYANLTKIA